MLALLMINLVTIRSAYEGDLADLVEGRIQVHRNVGRPAQVQRIHDDLAIHRAGGWIALETERLELRLVRGIQYGGDRVGQVDGPGHIPRSPSAKGMAPRSRRGIVEYEDLLITQSWMRAEKEDIFGVRPDRKGIAGSTLGRQTEKDATRG